MPKNSRVVASAARTTSGNSSAFLVGDDNTVNVLLDVSAASGTTPTLDVKVQWSMDNGTTWGEASSADTLAQKTTTGNELKSFTAKAPHARVVWTVGGTTPSFTFSVDAYSK